VQLVSGARDAKKEISGSIQMGETAAFICLNDSKELLKIVAS
jgi:hypothetical protein